MSNGFSHLDQERTRSEGKTGIPAPGGVASRPLAVRSARSQHQGPRPPNDPRYLAIVEFAIPLWPAGCELITGKFQGT